MKSDTPLRGLRNIGPTIASRLEHVGIATVGELRAIGPAEAYKRIKASVPDSVIPVCYYLYSLQGALDGIHWDRLGAAKKAALLAAVKSQTVTPKRTSIRPPALARDVAQVLSRYPRALRMRLLALRTLIYTTAQETPGVGALEEMLKWNEPAYLTSESKSGTSVRINRVPGSDSKYAIYFNCRTTLVDTFRSLFPRSFRYQGNRAIEFDVNEPVPVNDLKVCIGMALTYHRSRRSHRST